MVFPKPATLPKNLLEFVRTSVQKLLQTKANFLSELATANYDINTMELAPRVGKVFDICFEPRNELRWIDLRENLRSSEEDICHCALCRDGTFLSASWSSQLRKRKPSIRPNYFVALQVTNPRIHTALSDVQAQILAKCPEIKEAMVDIKTLHVTVMVLFVEKSEESLNRLKTAMDNCQSRIDQELGGQSLEITFKGLGNFKHNVLFASPVENENLLRLTKTAECIIAEFEAQNIHSTDGDRKDFKPHLTILKLSKSLAKLKKKGIKRIEPELYAEFVDADFGEDVFKSIQLCEMKRDDETGYYRIAYEVTLNKTK
ncbi:A-kinase anchor protein 7-like [Tubulanus polymorphus]|uniref:A-kinase anchor protein 7-like n=1 Tax=Tubulanus polymorphus TaxID=672921 RepID=UPI003DA51C17